MKRTIIFLVYIFCSLQLLAQAWTNEQLQQANTGKEYEYLTTEEKEIVQYINLCRLYPKQFAINEVQPYNGIRGNRKIVFQRHQMKDVRNL